MANGKNTGIGFRPLQGDISNDILNHEDQQFRHRREQREIADRKARAQALKNQKAQQALQRAKGLKLYDTGSDSLNGSLAEAITIATNEYPKIFDVLDDDTGKYSQSDKIKAKLKLDNIHNLPENLKTMTNAVVGEYQQYLKGVESGALFRDEDFEKKFENGFQGVSLSFDDDGLPVALFKKGGTDVNGDGVINELDVETMSSLNDVYSRPQFQKKYDFDSVVSKHAKELVSRVDTEVDGLRTTKTTGLDLNLLDKTANRALYQDGQPTDLMKSFVRSRGKNINNPEDLKTIESEYKNELLIRSKQGVEEEFDHRTALGYKKEKRLNKDNEISLGEPVTPTVETWGSKHMKNINPDKVNSVPVGNVKIDAIPLKDGRTITDAEVVNYTYDNNGNMIVDVVYQESKSETMSVNKYEKELEEATKNNDTQKIFALQQANEVDGGKRVTLPGKNRKEQISISKENESKIANQVAGSIEEAKKLAYKNDEDANKKNKLSDADFEDFLKENNLKR